MGRKCTPHRLDAQRDVLQRARRSYREQMSAIERRPLRLVMAGQRPSDTMAVAKLRLANLHLRLLADLQRIVDLDIEISHRAFELGVFQQ